MLYRLDRATEDARGRVEAHSENSYMYGWCFDIRNLLPLCILSIKIHRMPVDPCLKYTLSYDLLLPKTNHASQSLIDCKSKTTRHNVSVKRSSKQLTTHISQKKKSTTKPLTASPIPGGSFNALRWDFIDHGGMHCKMTTW